MKKKIVITQPKKIENRYERFLNSVIDRAVNNSKTLSKFNDSDPLQNMIDDLEKGIEDVDLSGVENFLNTVANNIIEYVTLKFPKHDLGRYSKEDEVFIEAFVSQNMLYFESMTLSLKKKVGMIVRNAIIEGDGVSKISAELSKTLSVSRADAKRIAITETARATQQLSRKRFKTFGVQKLTWSSAHDKRVRRCHLARDKKEYDINEGCYSGCDGNYIQCGQEVRCRCASIGVIEF